MARTRLLSDLTRILRIARFADANRLSTRDAIERLDELAHEIQRSRVDRRTFLGRMVGAGAALGVAGLGWRSPSLAQAGAPRIAIVGAGLAGLVCADRLRSKGYSAVLYEGSRRLGGRVASSRVFPGQVAERGGELINTLHTTMLGYAREFGLTREDLNKAPGDPVYHFFGQRYSEAEVVDEYRELTGRMRPDLRRIGQPTFFSHTEAEVALDRTDLASYLQSRAAGLPLIHAVLAVGYDMEYGRELHEQSCLNLLFFLHLDNRRTFSPTGVFDDERFHIVEGNDRIPAAIAARLPGPIETGAELTRLGQNGLGEYELWFAGAGQPERADAVVITVPFTALRHVELEASLGLSLDKLRAINDLPYGYNMKTMIGFDGRPWWTLQGSNGIVTSDLPNQQYSWETSWITASATSILTDYPGAARAKRLQLGTEAAPLPCSACHGSGPNFLEIDDTLLQQQAGEFLRDLDTVLPGTLAAASRVDGKYRVVRGHWLPQRLAGGSYACPQPGYFTTIAGLEAQSAGLLKFAGCHTNSFYDSQGYMEGACLSGIAAANELLEDIKRGRL